MREQQVLAYLKAVCKGRKNIQKSRQIQLALHINGNELRKQVHRLRQKGHPIASSQDGYFYAVTAGRGLLHHWPVEGHGVRPEIGHRGSGASFGLLWR